MFSEDLEVVEVFSGLSDTCTCRLQMVAADVSQILVECKLQMNLCILEGSHMHASFTSTATTLMM